MILRHLSNGKERYYRVGKWNYLVIEKGNYCYCFKRSQYGTGWSKADSVEYLGDRSDWEEITEHEATLREAALREGIL